MSTTHPTTIAGLVIMGGQNKRMNGNHKAFLKLGNDTFLYHIVHALSPCHSIYLSVDQRDKFSHLTLPLIEDYYEAIGPLGGLYSALKEVPQDYLFVTACDMPFITRDFVSYMLSQLHTDTECVVLCDESGFFYPLGALYSKSLIPKIESMIKDQNYRMQYLIKLAKSRVIPISETPFSKSLLRNVNTPEDYEACLKDISC